MQVAIEFNTEEMSMALKRTTSHKPANRKRKSGKSQSVIDGSISSRSRKKEARRTRKKSPKLIEALPIEEEMDITAPATPNEKDQSKPNTPKKFSPKPSLSNPASRSTTENVDDIKSEKNLVETGIHNEERKDEHKEEDKKEGCERKNNKEDKIEEDKKEDSERKNNQHKEEDKKEDSERKNNKEDKKEEDKKEDSERKNNKEDKIEENKKKDKKKKDLEKKDEQQKVEEKKETEGSEPNGQLISLKNKGRDRNSDRNNKSKSRKPTKISPEVKVRSYSLAVVPDGRKKREKKIKPEVPLTEILSHSDKTDKRKLKDEVNKSKIKYEDFPLVIQQKCTILNLDRDIIDKNIQILYNIVTFLYKEYFTIEHPEGEPDQKRRTAATPEMINKARSLITKPTDKVLKKHFKKFEMSGKGGFGSVFVTKDKMMKRQVAIKKLPHESSRSQLNNEIEIFFLSECKHPNIVEFYNCYEVLTKDQHSEIWIEMEYLEGGTLSQAAKLYSFSDKHIAYTTRECLKAIKYLHSCGFAHRDLKSNNIMMSVKGDIKIIDFGLCADFSEGPRQKLLGSPFWIPPEMIKNENHSFPVDIWSLAVCILELYLTTPPHAISPIKCMFMAATAGLIDQIPEKATPDARDFLSRCLIIDPNKRATASQLLNHKWLQQPSLEEGISEVLYQIFLSNSLSILGL